MEPDRLKLVEVVETDVEIAGTNVTGRGTPSLLFEPPWNNVLVRRNYRQSCPK